MTEEQYKEFEKEIAAIQSKYNIPSLWILLEDSDSKMVREWLALSKENVPEIIAGLHKIFLASIKNQPNEYRTVNVFKL